jgi:glycosyltransferase involved in cell wall biosynthesis
MNRRIIMLIALAIFTIGTVNARAIYDEVYNKSSSGFTVSYNSDFFYCSDDMIITIDSHNEINEVGIIRLELYWLKECEKEPLEKISDMEVEMKQKNIVINWTTNSYWGNTGPFSENDDERFTLRIYYNDTLISENNEIWIGCSKAW